MMAATQPTSKAEEKLGMGLWNATEGVDLHMQ